MKLGFSILIVMSIIVGAAFLSTRTAEADLMIYPLYAFFGDRDRVFDIALVNSADKAATFKLKLINLKQTETGGYIEVNAPLNPVFDSQKAIVFSPKQVNLPPHGKQRVRVSLRRPANLPSGEYRAHLRMEREAVPEKAGPVQPGKINTSVTINLAYSVPIIVRQGVSDTTAEIENIKLIPAEDKKPAFVDVNVVRSGHYGAMGNVKILWMPPGGSETQIGIINNFNIFAESAARKAHIPLTTPNIPNGSIRVIYEGDGPDKDKLFADKTFPIGG